jgi:hypothetical protein
VLVFPELLNTGLWQVQEQGYYQLKPKLWEEFDPLFAHFFLSELEEAQVC